MCDLEQQERVHKIFIFPIIKVWKKGKITGRRDALIDEKYNVDTIENWMYIKSYKLVKILGTITAKGKIFQPFPLPLNTLTKHFISIDTELIISQNPTIEEIQMFYVMGVYKIVIDENRNFAFKPLLIYHPLENERKVYLEQCLRALRIQKTLPPLDNATETSIVNDIVNANFECSKIFEGEFLAKDYFGG